MEDLSVVLAMEAELCQSLGHVTRLQLVHALKAGPRCVKSLAAELHLPQSTISRNLAILRSIGVLVTHRKGTEVYYEIADRRLVEVCEMMRAFLTTRELQRAKLISPRKARQGTKE